MAKKQTVSSEISSAGAAPVRVDTPKAKRVTATKHSVPKPGMQRMVTVPDVEEVALVEEMAIDREEVAKLAYLYWEDRGGHGGSAEEDWARAEEEVARRS